MKAWYNMNKCLKIDFQMFLLETVKYIITLIKTYLESVNYYE